MANSILASIFSKATTSVINDATGRTIWKTLKIRDVEVTSSAESTDSPISSIQYNQEGAFTSVLSDDIKAAKVITPSGMRITGFVDDVSAMMAMIADFNDTTLTVSVSAKSFIVVGMMPIEMEIIQSGEMLGVNKVVILLEQASPPAPDSFAPGQAADLPTFGARIQTPATFTESAKALYNRVSTKLGL